MTPDEIAAMRAELAGARRAWEENGRVIREMAAHFAEVERSLQDLAARAEALRRNGWRA